MSGTIRLATSDVSVREDEGVAHVVVERTGDTSLPVTVTYGITEGTAGAGDVALVQSASVTIAAGATSAVIDVAITNDSLSESTEDCLVSIINIDSGELLAPRTCHVVILDDENPVQEPAIPPLVSDYVVNEDVVVAGLNRPINIEFSPTDPATVFIADKSGYITTVDAATGAVLGKLLDISDAVNGRFDRGLIDFAFHPDFANHPYLYAYYVADPADAPVNSDDTDDRDGSGNRYCQLVRYTVTDTAGTLSVDPASKVILVGGAGQSLADISGLGKVNFNDPSYSGQPASDRYGLGAPGVVVAGGFKQDYIKIDSASHAGGAIAFGPDGMLYVSTGDGTSYNYADPRSVDVQDVNSLSGKILRIDPITGDGLADNPFVQAGDSLDLNRDKVWQYGLRNPFSMGFSSDGRLVITDTGWGSWEEINVGGRGANFGWPYFEGGDDGVSLPTRVYEDFTSSPAFYDKVASGEIVVTPAFRAFAHNEALPGYQLGAIVGGNVDYDGGRYPAVFDGDFFFADFPQGEYYSIDLDDRRQVTFLIERDQIPNKLSKPYTPVHFTQGPDGYVWYADLYNGEVGRLLIVEKNGGGAPTDGDDFLTGTALIDVIDALAGNDTVSARDGNDSVTGGAGNDVLKGEAGNDWLSGDAGADSLYGGAGDDTYVVDDILDKVSEVGAGGVDAGGTDLVLSAVSFTLDAFVENLSLTGTAAINGTGNGLANALTGNAFANRLVGGDGADTLAGGDGNDTLVGDAGADTLRGEAGADSLSGGLGDDDLSGGEGNDRLDGGAGADVMAGGAGNDIYTVGDLADQAIETAVGGLDAGGSDLVNAAVSFTLGAFLESLTLTGSGGSAGTGNDLGNKITGNAGANSLSGETVGDLADQAIETAAGGLDAGGSDLVNAAVSFTLGAFLESLTLTGSGGSAGTGNDLGNKITGNAGANFLSGEAGADRLLGGGGSDTLAGGAGNDTLTGDAGADTLGGDDGNDRLDGGAGADVMAGGAGNDTYTVDDGADRVIEMVVTGLDTGGTDLVSAAVSFTLAAFVENLTLTGSGATDGSGNDLRNRLVGNAGGNALVGFGGADALTGGGGDDLLSGGTAKDTLTGGLDADEFLFRPGTASDVDTVKDFSALQGDAVAIVAADFGLAPGSGLAPGGGLAADVFVAVSGTANQAVSALHGQFVYNTTSRTLLWDADGAGGAAGTALAVFNPGTSLGTASFHVYVDDPLPV